MNIIVPTLVAVLLLSVTTVDGTGTHALELSDQSISSDSSDDFDYAPIIGEYKVNGAYDEIIRQKEAGLNIVTRSANSSSKRLPIYQVPQEENYWCGYAAIKSLLDYEGISMTQAEIADAVYYESEPCPWYLTNGDSIDQFPVANFLFDKTDFPYAPFPYGGAGTTDITANDITTRVVKTIDDGHGVLACGTSYGNIKDHSSILPNYPASKIVHWLAIDGYKSGGSEIWIIDPAKSSVISWSNNINRYYSITASKLASFTQTRGIIW